MAMVKSMGTRVVLAAIQIKQTGQIITGTNHYECTLEAIANKLLPAGCLEWSWAVLGAVIVEGFMTNTGMFLNRQQAGDLARSMKQPMRSKWNPKRENQGQIAEDYQWATPS